MNLVPVLSLFRCATTYPKTTWPYTRTHMSAISYSELCYPVEGWGARWLEPPLPRSKEAKLKQFKKSTNPFAVWKGGGAGCLMGRIQRPPRRPQKANLQKAVRGKGKLVARLLQQFHEQTNKRNKGGALFQSTHGPKNTAMGSMEERGGG